MKKPKTAIQKLKDKIKKLEVELKEERCLAHEYHYSLFKAEKEITRLKWEIAKLTKAPVALMDQITLDC